MWNAPNTRIIILSAMAGLTLVITSSVGRPSGTTPQPTHDAVLSAVAIETTIQASDADQADLVRWGMDRFEEAGLTLPPLEVIVHDDLAGCGGDAGLYQHGDPARVHLCTLQDVTSRPARLITLHELGHAWAEQALDDSGRAAFLEIRSLDHWTDPDVPAWQWGAEHAAEVVSWGLMDEMVPIIRIYDAEPEQLREAFEMLVGRAPLVPDDVEEIAVTEAAPTTPTLAPAPVTSIQTTVTTPTGLPDYAQESANESIAGS
jgi:hypothetical protein